MVEKELRDSGAMLWQRLAQEGIRVIFKGADIIEDRPLSNLTEVLGIGVHEGLTRMMLASRVDSAYVTGGASDYDKLEALCKVLPLWSGHPYYEGVTRIIEKLTGEAIPVSAKNLPLIWQRSAAYLSCHPVSMADLLPLWGVKKAEVLLTMDELSCVSKPSLRSDDLSLDLCPVLPDLDSPALWRHPISLSAEDMASAVRCVIDLAVMKGCHTVAVDLKACEIFVRPNPYTPGQMVRKLQAGETLTSDERALILFQTLRLIGGECVRRGLSLRLLHTVSHVLVPLCEYLRGCHCLPNIECVTQAPGEILDSACTVFYETDACVSPEARKEEWLHLASQMPLGCLGGLYAPLQGVLDLPLFYEAGEVLCRCMADWAAAGRGTAVLEEQMSLIKHIFS